MKPLHQLVSDARTIQGIIEYLEQSVELNDDPESLLYAGNFEEYSRSYKKKGA